MFSGIYNQDKKKIIYSTIIVFIISMLTTLYIMDSLDISQENLKQFTSSFISNVITFVSICFGFYLTSISILFSSKFIKELNVEDKHKPDQRSIHTLKAYFKLAILYALITVAFSFLLLFIVSFASKYYISVFFSLFFAVFLENFYFIYLLLKVFLNALVFQARSNKDVK